MTPFEFRKQATAYVESIGDTKQVNIVNGSTDFNGEGFIESVTFVVWGLGNKLLAHRIHNNVDGGNTFFMENFKLDPVTMNFEELNVESISFL